MEGGAHAWVTIEQSEVQDIVLLPQIDKLNIALNDSAMQSFEDISGTAQISRNTSLNRWELTLDDLQFDYADKVWQASDSLVLLEQGGLVRATAEAINLDIIAEFITQTDVAGPGLSEQLTEFQPRGSLRNLVAVIPLDTTSGSILEFSANTDNVALNAVRGSPAMTGVSGYFELAFDFDRSLTTGLAEVESENLSIHIPSIFEDSWSYDYVNGSVHFEIDTFNKRAVKLSSGIVIAESDVVDGIIQFSSNSVTVNEERVAQDLALVIGARRVDGSLKTPYLPTGPNIKSGLRGTMEFLDRAVIDASITRSGIIYQGSLLPESQPNEKNFQAFFEFTDGQLEYSPDWPQLTDVSGAALIDGNYTDIYVDSAASDGLALTSATGSVRKDENGTQWVRIDGNATGTTQDGIDFLANAPLNMELGDVIADWEAYGDVVANVQLQIPLGETTAETGIAVTANLQDNSLVLPAYQLRFDNIAGSLSYDSAIGIHDSEFDVMFFESQASVSVSSELTDDTGFVTNVQVDGVVNSQVLAAWDGQSGFVRDVLSRTEGELGYTAVFSSRVDENQQNVSALQISSELEGLALDFPQPFRKEAAQPMPLSMNIDFERTGMQIQGVLGSQLSMQISLDDSAGLDGIVYAGTMPGIADPWLPRSTARGLELRGNLDIFSVTQWLDVMASTESVSAPSRDLTQWLSLVNLDVGMLDVFGQKFSSVSVEIQDVEDTDYWTIGLISDAVTGSVLIPFDRNEYIEAYLAYLRLQGNETEEEDIVEELAELIEDGVEEIIEEFVEEFVEEERVDILAGVDPRELPKFKFFTGNLTIGDKDYGLGQFTLDPTENGAEFSDLIVSFRGLNAGTIETDDEPHFSWHYDGNEHTSYLRGLILGDNLGETLQSNGYAASLESSEARFEADLSWPGSPAFFSTKNISGNLLLKIDEGRFLQGSNGQGALKLISIINLSAIMRRARFSDDLLRSGLAYDEIVGDLTMNNGVVTINDQLVIEGPSSVYQITGTVNLAEQTIDSVMYVTLPVSDNIPWLGLLTANLPIAIGAFLFDRIFGDRVDSLTSAQYILKGPWEGLQPEFSQAFGSPDDNNSARTR
jgi:uncharacterized protein YhdP